MESLLPFLQGTCTPYNMPVYPGAQRIIAESLIEGLSGIQWSLPRLWVPRQRSLRRGAFGDAAVHCDFTGLSEARTIINVCKRITGWATFLPTRLRMG